MLPPFKTCSEAETARWRNGSVTKALLPFSQCPWKPWSVCISLCGYQWSAASRGKGFGHWPPEEQAGELSASCKQAISVAQGTVLLCTAENVGIFLCSVKFREERALSHTSPCQFMLLSSFPEPFPVSCYNPDDDEEILHCVLLQMQEIFENNTRILLGIRYEAREAEVCLASSYGSNKYKFVL